MWVCGIMWHEHDVRKCHDDVSKWHVGMMMCRLRVRVAFVHARVRVCVCMYKWHARVQVACGMCHTRMRLVACVCAMRAIAPCACACSVCVSGVWRVACVVFVHVRMWHVTFGHVTTTGERPVMTAGVTTAQQ